MGKFRKYIQELIKYLRVIITDDKYKQSLKDTNDVVDVVYTFGKPVLASYVQLIKDCSVIVMLEPKTIAVYSCRFGFADDKMMRFIELGVLTRAEIEAMSDVKNVDTFCFLMSRFEAKFKGAYNKINQI